MRETERPEPLPPAGARGEQTMSIQPDSTLGSELVELLQRYLRNVALMLIEASETCDLRVIQLAIVLLLTRIPMTLAALSGDMRSKC